MAWLGTTFRLEARGRKLELRPTADGIHAVFLEDNEEIRSERVSLDDTPDNLLNEWIAQLPLPAPVTAPDADLEEG
jgi:hypothetical protein